MINYSKAKERFAQLTDSDFLNVIIETEKQFPLKLSQLFQHVENQNDWEIGYYALHIRESYAFVFHDTELNLLCHKIEDASARKDFQLIRQLSDSLKAYSVKFLQQLHEIKSQISDGNEKK